MALPVIPRLKPEDLCPCPSGRRVADCHTVYLTLPTPEFFFETIEAGLALMPKLAALAPTGYPRSGRGAVDYERALSNELTRTDDHPHNANLPLFLHLRGHPRAIEGVKSFARAVLDPIEAFVGEFNTTLHMRQVVESLWFGAWDSQPIFWSVLAHCHMALALKRGGFTVLGFEVPTGLGNKTADIHFRLPDGREVLQDLHMWNKPTATSREGLVKGARARAAAKADEKFGTLPAGTTGLITEVMMPHELAAIRVLRDHPEVMEPFELSPTCQGEMVAFGGVGDRDGRLHGLDFLVHGSPVRPLPPRATTGP